jgi:hypothetical protein
MDFRKSTYSSANGGACVEVAASDGVMVRDTTNRAGGTLSFTAGAWASFIAAIK